MSFLGDAPEVQARLAASLIAQPDHIVAASACSAAYDVARVWRTRAEEMLGLLAGCLGHPERTVRVAAIRSLAHGGVVPAQVADPVATVLDDDDTELRAWAAATLAHRGDARAVAPLTELLTRTECPWPCEWTASSTPPQRLLDMLSPYADATAGAVLSVAVVAAVVSYEHASALVRAHGESGWAGRLIPLTVDGLIYASSMVMLDSAAGRYLFRRWHGGCWAWASRRRSRPMWPMGWGTARLARR